MPISENELMWQRSVPEEAEASDSPAPEVVERLSSPEAPVVLDEENGQALGEIAADRGRGERTRLESALERLEMSSLQMKLYLDSIEQRISRIEPMMQAISQGAEGERAPGVVAPSGLAEERSMDPPGPAAAARTPEPDSAQEQEQKSRRWSHLMATDGVTDLWSEEGEGSPSGEAEAKPGTEATQTDALLTNPGLPKPEQAATSPAAQEKTSPSDLSEAAERRQPTDVVESSTPVQEQRRSPGLEDGAELRKGAPEVAWRGTLLGADDRHQQLAWERTESNGPRMWRGYRVSHLVVGFLLLLLALVPAVIWWRLSTEARDLDPAEPATSSLPSGPGLTPERARAMRRLGLGRGSAAASPPRATVAGGGDTLSGSSVRREAGTSAGGPVVKASEQPSASRMGKPGSLSVLPRLSDRRPGASLPAVVAPEGAKTGAITAVREISRGTAVANLSRSAEPPVRYGSDATDQIPGSSERVRVSGGVMAGRLLPTEASVGGGAGVPSGSGAVVAAVFISNTGRVEEVEVISGDRGLRAAAERAIRSWRYEPYIQRGVRVPVVTTAEVRFDGGTETP